MIRFFPKLRAIKISLCISGFITVLAIILGSLGFHSLPLYKHSWMVILILTLILSVPVQAALNLSRPKGEGEN